MYGLMLCSEIFEGENFHEFHNFYNQPSAWNFRHTYVHPSIHTYILRKILPSDRYVKFFSLEIFLWYGTHPEYKCNQPALSPRSSSLSPLWVTFSMLDTITPFTWTVRKYNVWSRTICYCSGYTSVHIYTHYIGMPKQVGTRTASLYEIQRLAIIYCELKTTI